MLAQSSFVGARLIRTTQVSKGSRRSSLIVEARRTKASAPSRSAAKVRTIFNRQLTENLRVPRWTAKSQALLNQLSFPARNCVYFFLFVEVSL
jgi:hypothetical protein